MMLMWFAVLALAPACMLGAGAEEYNIADGHSWGAYEYIDTDGYHKGFSRDLVKLVCEKAGVKCNIQYNQYTDCIMPGDKDDKYNHHEMGPGLKFRGVDACLPWWPTVERIHFVDFALPFTKLTPAYLFYKKGSGFTPDDIGSKKIGFMKGWATNKNCLANELKVSHESISGTYMYNDVANLLAAMESSTVDAGFGSMIDFGSYIAGTNDYKLDYTSGANNTGYHCTLAGLSIAVRQDSKFDEIWNRGFEISQKDGSFKALCEQSNKSKAEGGHGLNKIDCIDAFSYYKAQ